MKILIGADIVPVKSNMEFFERGEVEKLVDPTLAKVLQNADYRIFNLEVPLTDRETPISKCGPALIAPTKSAKGIKALGADFLTLANNHILDQGEQGLQSTIAVLNKLGIAHAGVGANLAEAQKPFILDDDGNKIGIYCCAEHEFSIAGEHNAGANPFDPLESLDHIASLKSECDSVIVLYHGGKEKYRYPSPYLQKVCRKIVEKGADLVVCQHTHCIGCEEKYLSGTIVYGQGNFLFDDCDNEYWNTSLLISLHTDNMQDVDYLPLVKRGSMVALAVQEKKEILNGFLSRSDEIQKEGLIEEKYSEIAYSQYVRYLSMLQGKRYSSYCFRAMNKLTGHRLLTRLLHRIYNNENAHNQMINVMECEVHRECFLHYLKTIGR